jgi:hypothetical protein
MAYLDLQSRYETANATPLPVAEAFTTEHRRLFSALDWSVVALARHDSLASLGEPSPLARAFGGLFGFGRASRLADPRLEAIRRLAVHAWHRGYTLPVSEIKAFLAAGFEPAHVETLLASVAIARAAAN